MKIIGRLILVFSFLLPLKIFSQNFPEFDSLKKKAYSAYDIKDYLQSARYFESALNLPENKRPEIFWTIYYDVACAFSLNSNVDKSLYYLEKCFSVWKSKLEGTPVSVMHIATDGDLDFIRNQPRFHSIIKQYYSLKDQQRFDKAQKFSGAEISYPQLLELLRLYDKKENVSILNKTIYWEKKNGKYIYNPTLLTLPDAEVLKGEGFSF